VIILIKIAISHCSNEALEMSAQTLAAVQQKYSFKAGQTYPPILLHSKKHIFTEKPKMAKRYPNN